MPTRLYCTARDGAAATLARSAHVAVLIAADYPGLAGIPVPIDTATIGPPRRLGHPHLCPSRPRR